MNANTLWAAWSFLLENQAQVGLLTGQHLLLFALSLALASLPGIMIGILAARPEHPALGRWLLSFCAAAQAVPSVAVIALAFLVLGVGALPAVLALVLYSLVPIVFNTTAGILSVPVATVQAARGMGLTHAQILRMVELPLAAPAILAGLRSAATINVGAATVASFIGGGGLGDLVFMGLKLYRPDIILVGSLLCALIAIVIDACIATAGHFVARGRTV